MVSENLRGIANRGLIVGPSPMLRHHESGRWTTADGIVFTAWGYPGAAFNKACALGPTPPLARIVELARAFFGAGPDAYGVLVEADAGHPVEAELRAAGWTVLEDEPALVLPALPSFPPPPPGLDVRRAVDAAGRRDFNTVAAAGFGAPTADSNFGVNAADLESFGPSLACMLDPDVAVFVGYADGRPASSAIMYRVDEIAVLTGVATVPAYRRRGFARALTWTAASAGADLGCTCATLGGLGASYEMYRGMGFLHVCNHRLYVPPVSL